MFPFLWGTGVAVCTNDFGSGGNCSTQLFPTKKKIIWYNRIFINVFIFI